MALSTISTNAITDGTIATADIADSAVTAAKASGLGISEADQYRITSGFTQGGSQSIISSNWERADSDGFGVKGTGLTESSGVFTFPSTGYWKIDVGMIGTSSNDEYFRIRLMYGGTSGENSFVAEGYESSGAGSYMQTGFSCIIKNTDTAADKFSFYNSISSGSIKGDTGGNSSGFVCTKIAEI